MGLVDPNLEIEIHDSELSLHSWGLRKIIIEPLGATQILHTSPKYGHSTYSKNPILRFGLLQIFYETGRIKKIWHIA